MRLAWRAGKLIAALGLTLAALAAPAVHAQPFPAKPVTIVVPFSASGPSDILARLLAEKLSVLWRQPVVVDNKVGATGTIGSGLVARAKPDGLTLLMASTSCYVAPYMYGKVAYDQERDLTPLIKAGSMPLYLVASPSFPAVNFGEWLAEVKRKPGQYAYSSAGIGAVNHLSMELLKSVAGLDVMHVPYKGAAPALQAAMSGEVAFTFDTVSQAQPQVQAGKLKALAVSGAQRSAVVPKVPTVAESGLPSFTPTIWFGLFTPAKTPAAVMAKLHDDLSRVLTSPEVQARLATLGVEYTQEEPAAYRSFVAMEAQRWKKLITDNGIKAD